MKTTIKTISIETLAEKINGKLWAKGDVKRIYLDKGYNTKKMSTKTYVFQKQNGTFGVSCTIICPSQNIDWINSQEEAIANPLMEQIAEIIEEFGCEIENPQIKIQTALDAEEKVQGYYMRCHEERVAINSYGKLAYRRKQKVHTYKGATAKAPVGFIALNNEDFSIALEKEEKEILYEYGQEPNLQGEAQRVAERKTKQEEAEKQRTEEAEKAAKAKAEEADKKREDLVAKLAEINPNDLQAILFTWKINGFFHPAPAEVMIAKAESGLNWKKFTEAIQ